MVSIDYAAPDLEDASRARIEMLVDAFQDKQNESKINKKMENFASKYVVYYTCACACACVRVCVSV